MDTLALSTAFKNSSYVISFVLASAYLKVDAESIAILAAVILLDIITGVLRSAVTDGWRSITSSRFTAGVLAKLLLILIPISLALAGKGVDIDIGFLIQGSITVLILAQVYSIIGNIHSMRKKEDKNEFDAVEFIMRQLRDVLERSINAEKKPPTNDHGI